MWRDFGYFVMCYHTLAGDDQGAAKAKYLDFPIHVKEAFNAFSLKLEALCQWFAAQGMTLERFRESLGLYEVFSGAQVFILCDEVIDHTGKEVAVCDLEHLDIQDSDDFEGAQFAVTFTIRHHSLEDCERKFVKYEGSKIKISNEILKIDENFSGRKLGTLLVYQSALAAFDGKCSEMFYKIVADAGKNASFFGYYHWPRVGFDVDPDHHVSIELLSDIMQVESFTQFDDDDLDEWKDVGKSLMLALTPGLWDDHSRHIMESYLY